MKRNLIRSVAVAGALAITACLAACGGGSGSGDESGPVTITLSHGYTDVEAKELTAEVDEWNQDNPDIQVKLQFNGGNDYALQKTLAGFTSGKYPDIAYEYGSSAAQLSHNPKTVDLTSWSQSSDVDWSDFYPSEQQAGTVDDKVVGVPALVDNLALVYNKKLFQQAGVPLPTADWTWDDFRSAAAKLTDSSTKTFGWAYVNDGSEDTVWRFLPLLWQAGGDLLNSDNTEPAFDSAAGASALQLLQDMAVTDKSVYLDNGNGNYLNLFNSGKIAMLWTGPWDISSIDKSIDYGISVLPGMNGDHESVSGPDMYMVFDNGDARREAALKFLAWLTSAQTHLQFAVNTGDLPIRQSETQLPDYEKFLANYPADKVFVQNLDNVKHVRPNVTSYGEISTAIGQMVQSVLLGQADPQEALDAAKDQVAGALAGQ